MSQKLDRGLASAALYIGFQIIANIMSIKITTLGSWETDAGTLIYPLTFTLRDFVHKTLGKSKARQLVIWGGILNFSLALCLLVTAKLTPATSWPFQNEFVAVLLPVWRITFGSIIAAVVSELIDTEVFSHIYHKVGEKRDVLAVLASNFVSLIFDSAIFTLIAFWGTGYDLWQIFLTNAIIKVIMSLLSSPTIKFIPRTVEESKI